MGILSGPEIRRQILLGAITIVGHDDNHINPNSIDLVLAPQLRSYLTPTLDAKKDNPTNPINILPDGLILRPGELYLGSTIERVHTDHFVAVVEGKSSLGRLGLVTHQTAGYIDCGFDGQITLELTVTMPLRIYAGMRICQLCFMDITGEKMLYAGKYQHQKGAQASRAWQDFTR